MQRSMRNIFKKVPGLSILCVISIAPIASAATQLHFDINDVTVTTSPNLTGSNLGTYTGTVTLSKNNSTFLEGIAIDGTDEGAVGTVTALSGTFHMSGGDVSSSPASSLTFTIKNSDNSSHTYTGTLDDATAESTSFIQADANPSFLDSTNFGGVDVTPFALQNVDGAVSLTNFPGSLGNLEVYLPTVPEPAVGLIGLVLLGATRIRGRRV